ncbi:nuclear transport factor 2 family protein [Streptomyces sp. V1I1]|uniref:nuclear transport factor 2 family protein n=1 Tax=Streptomyces sp. V1I1 TaxID=3042272 RepID=UPI002789694D|nr:nuclear transport factor 2 family protein [Streptomyces sp. V1I1]MDQ0941829.1 limonene-1,2-epoxide hydrolase [Streptomyces sp. V1I1]
MTELRKTVESYWTAAEARDWAAFASTLGEDVLYDLPQTRERIHGKEKYLQFNREYPGDWHIRVQRIVADGDQVVTWVHAVVGLEEMYAITFFTGDEEGRITAITDFWPEAYEPPSGREHLVARY